MTSRSAAPAPAPRFEGFADTRGDFFSALTLHNDRDWFLAHKAEYEAGWLAPMKALLAELREGLAPAYRGLELGAPRVFRIQRDLRFSKEKVPYKTHVGGLLPLGGAGGPFGGPCAVYVHVSHDEAFAGAGCYALDPAGLARHRTALLDPRRGAAAGRLTARLEAQGFALSAIETLKRPPPGVPADHPRLDLLRMKGLVASVPLPRRLLAKRALLDEVLAQARAAAPLVRWLVSVG
jgi:uncharacterized protein (TIGR02453 family)